MDHSINIYKDAMTSELCDELIALHKKEKEYTEKEVYGQGTNVQCYNLYLDSYPEKDKKVFDTRCTLKPYQIPYIESPTAFKNKIIVKSLVTNKRVVEY